MQCAWSPRNPRGTRPPASPRSFTAALKISKLHRALSLRPESLHRPFYWRDESLPPTSELSFFVHACIRARGPAKDRRYDPRLSHLLYRSHATASPQTLTAQSLTVPICPRAPRTQKPEKIRRNAHLPPTAPRIPNPRGSRSSPPSRRTAGQILDILHLHPRKQLR